MHGGSPPSYNNEYRAPGFTGVDTVFAPAALSTLWVLRKFVGDFVVIAFIGTIDMLAQDKTGRIIQRAGPDGNHVRVRRFPKKRRTADGTEAAPCFGRGLIPGEIAFAFNFQRCFGCGSSSIKVSGLFSALCAMAGDYGPHFPGNGETNTTAQTRTFPLFSHRWIRTRSYALAAIFAGVLSRSSCKSSQTRNASSSAWLAFSRGSQCV